MIIGGGADGIGVDGKGKALMASSDDLEVVGGAVVIGETITVEGADDRSFMVSGASVRGGRKVGDGMAKVDGGKWV